MLKRGMLHAEMDVAGNFMYRFLSLSACVYASTKSNCLVCHLLNMANDMKNLIVAHCTTGA